MLTFEDDLPEAGPRENAHTKFRQKKVWKDFRAGMLAGVGYRCQLCNGLYRGHRSSNLQVHHLDPENYEVLEPERFRVLCTSCHNDFVEIWVTRIQGKVWTPNPHFVAVYRALADFLPHKARERARDWVDKILSGE